MPEFSESNRAGGDYTEKVDADESDSEPGGFTISVDLSACVGAPAHCRVWVRRRARKVRWLASRVRRAAKLRGSLLLLAGDHLLPPCEPLRVLRPDDTLRIARVEHEWQHAFSFADSDEEAVTYPPPTQSTPAVVQPTSPKKITSEKIRKPKDVTPVVPSCKRKFTVGDTLFLLNQTAEERTPTTRESETEHPPSAERLQPTSEVGRVAQESITMDQGPEPNVVDHDALNRVKQRALALLEQVADEKDTDVLDAPKKKRRRVRRRRPAPKPYNPEESVQELDGSGPGTIQNGSLILNQRNHVDMTKEQNDSVSETKQRLLGLVIKQNQDPSEDQDMDNDSNINGARLPTAQFPSPAYSAVLSSKALTPSLLAAQPSPQWVMDFAELPSETQVPVLVRNSAQPRAPRVVRALGSETTRDILVEGCL